MQEDAGTLLAMGPSAVPAPNLPRLPALCAVMVTYHPGATTLTNLPKVLAQVQELVVVDNGSAVQEVELLLAASQSLGFELIQNRENLGIAEALNQGVRWAKDRCYSWLLLLDQDSEVTDGYVSHMFSAWQFHSSRERVGYVHPRYIDPKSGYEAVVTRARDGGPVRSLTSGALMPSWIFDKIGWFASEYFIDQVDTEYCYRIRAAGYLIADSAEAVLRHPVGDATERSICGFKFRPTNHSPVRRYYMSRNRIVVFRKYFRRFPRWILQAMYESFRETAKCFVGEKDRARKFRYFLIGTWDGLTGRMGKRDLESTSR